MIKAIENQSVQLVNDTFSPMEVSEMVLRSIDVQINEYKLKNLSNWIKDHNCDQDSIQEKIKELESRKIQLKEMIEEARMTKCNLNLRETLEIGFDR